MTGANSTASTIEAIPVQFCAPPAINITDAFVEALEEGQATLAAHSAVTAAMQTEHGITALRDSDGGARVVDLEEY